MTIENKGAITSMLNRLRNGGNQSTAVRKLWDYTFSRLVRMAHAKLRNSAQGAADEEDVALSVFQSFYRGVAAGRFPDLSSRDSLWRVLYTITRRKVIAQKAHERAQKRDAGRVVDGDMAALVDPEPSPALAAMLVDELRCRLDVLRDDTLRQIALLLLEGSSNEDVAARLGCSVRTVERKRDLIRRAWEREQTP